MITMAIVIGGLIVFAAGAETWLLAWPIRPDWEDGLDFTGVAENLDPAPKSHFTARDGTELDYRAYPASRTRTLVIVLHGSSGDGRYLAPLARALAERDAAHVVTPDIRGHGRTPVRRGDVDDVEQPQRDLVDLVTHLRERWTIDRVVLIGHSSGGGLAVRMGGGRFADAIDDYVLLAPYLGYDAPTTRPGSGGWAQANVGRIVLIEILSGFGFEDTARWKVVRFNIPETLRDKYSTPAYSYRMQQAMEPRDWREDLSAMDGRVLLLVGEHDEAMRAERYRQDVAPHIDGTVKLLVNVGHMDIVRADTAVDRIERFIRQPGAQSVEGQKGTMTDVPGRQ